MGRSLGDGTIAVLNAIRSRLAYGLDIVADTGMLPGTVYTTLRRLERRGWIEGRWEDPAVAEAERRPRRRYYTLTSEGREALDQAEARLEEASLGEAARASASGRSG